MIICVGADFGENHALGNIVITAEDFARSGSGTSVAVRASLTMRFKPRGRAHQNTNAAASARAKVLAPLFVLKIMTVFTSLGFIHR